MSNEQTQNEGQMEPGTDWVEAVELAWGIIANVSGGDWAKQDADWREAARLWADRFLPALGPELQRRATPTATTPTHLEQQQFNP